MEDLIGLVRPVRASKWRMNQAGFRASCHDRWMLFNALASIDLECGLESRLGGKLCDLFGFLEAVADYLSGGPSLTPTAGHRTMKERLGKSKSRSARDARASLDRSDLSGNSKL